MAKRVVMKGNPKVKATVLGDVQRRMGATMKWRAVLYKSDDGEMSVRDEEEFTRLFEELKPT